MDSDAELSELCARMREAGNSACTIVFCESDVYIEGSRSSVQRESDRSSPAN
ncbi:MAG: hypothetical protein WDO69_08130 [Pseudomonadota bacterium]